MVMQPGWTEEIRILPKAGREKEAMERAGSFAAAIGFQNDRIEDIRTSVSEACLNAIEHTEGRSDTVLVRFLRDGAGMKITVANKGKPFSPVEGKPDIREKMEGRSRPRGWGVYLMRELSDEVEITHDQGVTTVTITYRL
jgi:serine/threonine-protein kinase RsbW